jgi:hypothetical protein
MGDVSEYLPPKEWANPMPPEEFAENWRKTRAPYRFTENELQIYGRLIREAAAAKDNPKMVVLGVTPELRMLGHQHGCRVTCVDFSPMWINAMDILMGEDGKEDIIVRCNWLETPLQRGEYDTVVGDYVLNCLKPTKWDRLLRIVHDLLKPGGYFVTRTLVGVGDPVPLLDALKMYGKQLLRYPDKYLVSLCYTTIQPDGQWGSHILKEQLEKLHEDGGITDDEFNTLSVLCARAGSADTYMLKQKNYEEILSRHLQIEGFEYDKELHNVEGLLAKFPIHWAVKM